MVVLLVLVLGAMIVFFVGEYPQQVTAVDTPAEWDTIRGQEESFRLFSYAAENFMAAPVPARPATGQPARQVDWTVLRLHPSMAPASRGVTVPVGWKLVYDAERWAICAPMPTTTANAITDRDPLLSETAKPIRYIVPLSSGANAGRAILADYPENAARYAANPDADLAAYVALCRSAL